MLDDSVKRNTRPGPDLFGCPVQQIDSEFQLISNDIKIFRKKSGPEAVRVIAPPSERGFLIGVSMAPGHRRQIEKGVCKGSHSFEVGSIYLRGFDEDYEADLSGSFDFVLLEISSHGLQNITEQADVRHVSRLSSTVATPDRTLGGLASAIFASAARHEPSKLFIDQISQAIGAHVVRMYGRGRETPVVYRRKLSPERAARAKEMLWNNLAGEISLDELAASCGMSRDAFLVAFKNTLGMTPFSWLVSQRMEIARSLLTQSKLTLAEVAGACGYSAQSQFTRAFTAAHGQSPGFWRKQRT